MSKFVYVFTEESKNALLSQGFVLIKEDTEKSVYVFENKNEKNFSLSNVDFVYSNILTF